MWNLDSLIRRTVSYIGNEDDVFQDGDYMKGTYLTSSDAKKIINQVTSSLNDIIKKATRDYSFLTTKDEKLKEIDTDSLSETFLKVKDIFDQDGFSREYKDGIGTLIDVVKARNTDTLTIEYYYLHPNLVSNTDMLLIPEYKIEPVTFCHYSAFEFLSRQPDNKSKIKAQDELSLFEELYNKVISGVVTTVECEEGW